MSLLQADFSDPKPQEEKATVSMDVLGAYLQGLFQEAKDARVNKEQQWLDDLRYFNSQYTSKDMAVIAENSQNDSVFFSATRMKTVAAYGRIIDLLFHPGQPYGLCEPTPIPDTKDFKLALDKAKAEITALVQQGQIDPNTVDVEELVMKRGDELRSQAIQDAHNRMDKMNELIQDQLKECGSERKLKRMLAEMCVLGDGCIKGSTINVRGTQKWQVGNEGWNLNTVEEVFPDIEHRSIFDIYPDPFANSMDELTHLFDRHKMTHTDLSKLAMLEGFDGDKIRNILTTSPDGNYVEESHEIERRSIGGVNTSQNMKNRYDVLEFWGAISGEKLQMANVEVEDLTKEYQANVWICNGQVIKAMLNPLLPTRIPYQIVPYEFNIHSFWGTGIPRMMVNSQKMMNGAARAIEQNMAYSSGVITEINTDLLRPGESADSIKPNDVKLRSGGNQSDPLLRFHKVPDNSGSFMGLMAEFRKYTDEETSMPSYSHGQAQAGMTKTASGMSMLMGAANVALKSTIKNIDDYCITPMIQSFYDHNMKWSDREDIKGDAKVVAQGSTALMAKEVKSEKLMQFMQLTANPVDAQLVERQKLLKEVASALEINPDILYSEQEIEARQQQQASANAANQQQAMAGDGGNIDPRVAQQASPN